MPFYKNNWKIISSLGITIYLQNSLPELINRLKNNNKDRPKWTNPDDIELLYNNRLATYLKADHIINCDRLKADVIVSKIINII